MIYLPTRRPLALTLRFCSSNVHPWPCTARSRSQDASQSTALMRNMLLASSEGSSGISCQHSSIQRSRQVEPRDFDARRIGRFQVGSHSTPHRSAGCMSELGCSRNDVDSALVSNLRQVSRSQPASPDENYKASASAQARG